MSAHKKVWPVIMRRELASFFASPIAYIVTALFLAFSGFLFFSTFFLANRAELRNFFNLLPILFAFFIPALTMRLFSEETRSGSIETLLTLPASAFDAALGKFLASFAFTASMLAPTLVYLVTASALGNPDPGPVIGGYLGSLFLASAYCAIGVFASAVTKNQIVAFFVAFTICILLSMFDNFLVLLPASVVGVLELVSANYHFTSIARGIIDTRDLLYFLSVTAIFFGLAVEAMNARRAA
jgi:ABC-2 type transport system permease protein